MEKELIEQYYQENDVEKRRALLDYLIEKGEDSEDNQIFI